MIHLVLYQPEIPQNAGNMMRTCMASNTHMHLIKPLGFSLDEKHLKRAGMDYIDNLQLSIYENWDEFVAKNPSDNYYIMSRYGKQAPGAIDFTKCVGDIYLILGRESTGVPKEIIRKYFDHTMRLPMVKEARSLNLSNCAAIIIYEVLRQLDYPGLSGVEYIKGEDFIFND